MCHIMSINDNRSSAHCRHNRRRPLAPSLGNASVLIARLSTLFRRTPSNINEATGLRQRPRGSIFSRSSPRVANVAPVRDRQVCLYLIDFQPPGSSDFCANTVCYSAAADNTNTAATRPITRPSSVAIIAIPAYCCLDAHDISGSWY
ncbi:hypothetical protein BDR03DRAFT_969788 [Suillus americanus]|nr:hypothetical protein BDR03DRAFT_969788 [Suillus americanus]